MLRRELFVDASSQPGLMTRPKIDVITIEPVNIVLILSDAEKYICSSVSGDFGNSFLKKNYPPRSYSVARPPLKAKADIPTYV